jgi:hypothetical protein
MTTKLVNVQFRQHSHFVLAGRPKIAKLSARSTGGNSSTREPGTFAAWILRSKLPLTLMQLDFRLGKIENSPSTGCAVHAILSGYIDEKSRQLI